MKCKLLNTMATVEQPNETKNLSQKPRIAPKPSFVKISNENDKLNLNSSSVITSNHLKNTKSVNGAHPSKPPVPYKPPRLKEIYLHSKTFKSHNSTTSEDRFEKDDSSDISPNIVNIDVASQSSSSPSLSRRWSSLSGSSNFISSSCSPEAHSSCSEGEDENECDEDTVSLNSNSLSQVSSSTISETKEQERKDRKAFLAAQELTKTEEDFVENLHLLNVHFRKAVKPYLPEDVLNNILRYLPELQATNEKLLEEFRNRIEKWNEKQKIADVLVKIGPFLKQHAFYIQYFVTLSKHFEEAIKKYPEFTEALREFEKQNCKQLLVKHFMHKPVQRLPQYILLLNKYKAYLSVDHPDYQDTLTALELARKIAADADNSFKNADNTEKLLRIQNSLIGHHTEIIKPGRCLIKEGELLKISRREKQPRWFILCNDCLIYLTSIQHGLYRLNHELSLTGMRIHISAHQEFQEEFCVISEKRSISIAAKSIAEKEEWISALQQAIDDYAARRSTFLKADKKCETTCLLGFEAPIWVPDDRVTICQLCEAEFTIAFRRHHCRACGKVVCSICSSKKAKLKYLNFEPSRICDKCFTILESQQKEYAGIKQIDSHDTFSSNHLSSTHDEPDDNNNGSASISSNQLDSSKTTSFTPSFKRSSGRRKTKVRSKVLKEVSADDEDCSISGYLYFKKLGKKNWKKKWFVVKNKVLYCFGESRNTAADHSCPLLGFQVSLLQNLNQAADNEYLFELSHNGHHMMIFKAETEDCAHRWIKAIEDNNHF